MSDIEITSTADRESRRTGLADFFIRLLKEKPLGTFGALVVLLLLICGIFAEALAPYDMAEVHMKNRFEPPSTKYLLGTDNLGRDLLSRIIFGARISLIVGLAGSALATLVATIIGLVSGYIGGKLDIILQRFVDAWMCFPMVLLLIVIISLTGPGLAQVIYVVGMVYGVAGSRVIRSAVIAIKENTYVRAAEAVGCSTTRMMIKHILPNVMSPIIVLFTTRLATVILVEASLSFLGYGIPPPTPSWGGMLSGYGREYMLRAPGMAFWPGFALAIVVYGVNMFGDAMRDLLDPRLKGGMVRYSGGKKEKKSRITKGKKKN